jgi:hypothetical protein
MTERPAFFPLYEGVGVDDTQSFKFAWNPGFAFSQKQKNVLALHEAIKAKFPGCRPLEISSKSMEEIGVRLSAFNLSIPYAGGRSSVESVFQASKVFESGGPFPDLYTRDSREVRDFIRGEDRGRLVAFDAHGVRWGLNPTRAFYDWIYIKFLVQNQDLAETLGEYDCFTDIEFNPKKSLNCQAYAVALYLSMLHAGVLNEALKDKESFLQFHPTDIVVVGKGTNSHVATSLAQPTFGF